MYYREGSPKNRNSLEFDQKIKRRMELHSLIWIKYTCFLWPCNIVPTTVKIKVSGSNEYFLVLCFIKIVVR